MTATAINRIESNAEQSLLIDRFILTQVASKILVFPATWVAEVLRIDRSFVLNLPFYNRLLVGIVDRNGQALPLINTASLLKLDQPNSSERLVVVRLDRAEEGLINVGLIVDRLIGNTTRSELPTNLFATHNSGEMILIQSHMFTSNLWNSQY